MEIKKTINVKFNSNFKLNGAPNTLVNNNTAEYYIDWSSILKNDGQKYLLTWSYVSQRNTFTIDTPIASVYINIYCENYMVNTLGASTTLNIGNLAVTTNSLYADSNTNSPIFLNSRPTNNNVNIQILTNSDPPIGWTDNTAIPLLNNNYILTLTFVEL